MKSDKKISIFLYYQMLRIRMVEEEIARIYHEQEMRCPVHLCTGQEAIPAGVCANLQREDYVLSNHRSHGHYLAKGGNMRAMFAEIYGKAAGCSAGKGGSMHLADLKANILGTTPIVAGVVPVAAGAAFGSLLKKEKKVTVVFIGEAATEEGVFCETLNFASLKKLPIVFVCENNFFSVYSPLSVRQPKERDNVRLAGSYGIPGAKKDGNDVLAVYEAAKKAVDHARKKGPYYLEFETYRWREHCGPNYDLELCYRDKAEYDRWKKRCPVESLERKLIKEKILTAKKVEGFRTRINREITEAIRFAKKSKFPESRQAFSGVYA